MKEVGKYLRFSSLQLQCFIMISNYTGLLIYCYIHTYILLIKTTSLYTSLIWNEFFFCKPSGIWCLRFDLFDRCTLLLTSPSFPLSQRDPLFIAICLFSFLWFMVRSYTGVSLILLTIPSCIQFWEFMSLSIPQI